MLFLSHVSAVQVVTQSHTCMLQKDTAARYRRVVKVREDSVFITDLPTFYAIKAEDLPPFNKKMRKIFVLGKYSDFYLPVTQNEPIFSVLTSPNSTDIAKLVLNSNMSRTMYRHTW